MVLSEEASISFQQLGNHPSSRLKRSIQVDPHWNSSGSLGRRQTPGNSIEVKLRVPLPHPAKSKVGTSNQVKLYKLMNTLTHLKNFEQLAEILWKRVLGEHRRKHRRQGLLTAINNLSNMLGVILQ
jgi:hypothetical protein